MTVYIALLRAVNVGGTGKLPMADLKRLCVELGFSHVQTYIASGNVVFQSALAAVQVQQSLEEKLHDYAGKPVGVLLRTADEMREVLKRNPFPDGAPNRVMALFLDDSPSSDTILNLKGQAAEVLALGAREIYIHYGDGMANSKLQIPAAKTGTARNMNTVAKLAEMANAR